MPFACGTRINSTVSIWFDQACFARATVAFRTLHDGIANDTTNSFSISPVPLLIHVRVAVDPLSHQPIYLTRFALFSMHRPLAFGSLSESSFNTGNIKDSFNTGVDCYPFTSNHFSLRLSTPHQ